MKSTAIQGAGGIFAAAPKMRQNLQEDKVQEVDFSAVISQAGLQNQTNIQNQNNFQGAAKSEDKDMGVKEVSTVKKTEAKEADFDKTKKYQKAQEPEKAEKPENPEMQPTEEDAEVAPKNQKADGEAVLEGFEEIPEKAILATAGLLSGLKEAFSKELSMTEEELLAALEELGFSVADFVDPETVNICIRSLCGAQTVTELLVDAELYETYSQIQSDIMDLTSEFGPDIQLSQEELQSLMLKLEEMQEAEAAGSNENLLVAAGLNENPSVDAGLNESLPVMAGLNENQPESMIAEVPRAEAEVPMEKDTLPEKPMETVRTLQQETTAPLSQKQAKTAPQALEEATEEKPEAEVKPISENLQQMEQNQDTAQQNLLNGQNQPQMQTPQPRVENAFQPEMPFTPFTNYDGSYESIIRQVAEQVRVRVTADASSMEMQLNPESLGKLSLSVEMKQGMMTAKFVAETEQVKEAIESQAVLLREDLDKQGVKVEAIEVAVETHEFERNLEQGQQQSQAEEEARNAENERSRSRRNLNLDILEEEDELTEAEDLAAKIMKENGNTMDYFA